MKKIELTRGGVALLKVNKKWVARITFNSKPIYLGCFYSEVEAARCYNRKAKELFGEYAFLNVIE